MTVWDSSAIVPLFDDAHPHHAASAQRFDAAEVVLLHPCVILEVTTYLRRQAKDQGLDGNRTARTFLKALLAQPRVRVDAPPSAEGAVRTYFDDGALSFADACVVALAKERDVAVVAFDGAIEKAVGRRA